VTDDPIEGALDWKALESELPEPNLQPPDDARHVMLGIMGCAESIGLGEAVWDHIKQQVPKWADLEAEGRQPMPEPNSLEYVRMADLVIEAVPVAEAWLKGWLRDHGVPYVQTPVVCPAHGMYVFLIGDEDQMHEQLGPDVHEGLNPLMEF